MPSQPNPVAEFLIYITVGIFSGLLIGVVPTYMSWFGLLTNWQKTSPPGEDKVIKIEYRSISTNIAIYTEGQKVYVYSGRDWKKITPSEKDDSYWILEIDCGEKFIDEDYFWVYPPPRNVISRLDCEIRDSEIAEIHRFVLLNSGDIWIWRIESDIDSITPYDALYLAGICMSILGGFVGINIFLFKPDRPIYDK